ncbi:MAG TPA: hypothetical protein VKM54_28320 [Myxococcota bacterium]|nr:hypothetical protein [Myxococcota bacterium]
MRPSPAFAVVLFTLACAQAGGPERLALDDRWALRRNDCKQAAWDKCDGAREHADCVEREALPCNTQVENTVDPNPLPPRPNGMEDSGPAAPSIEPVP